MGASIRGATALLNSDKIKAERCRRSFHYFIKEFWNIVDPSDFADNWHIEAIANHLQAVSEGRLTRVVVNIPPRSGKSTICSVMYQAWDWIQHPERQFLTSSYALALSIRDSNKTLRLVSSEKYQRFFPHVRLSGSQAAKSNFMNLSGGTRVAISVGSMATGFGGDIVVCDDPHNASESDSSAMREATIDWWTGTMSSRLNDPQRGSFIIIMQRLHEGDLTGHVLKEGGWTHLCLPAEYEGSTATTSIGWSDPRTKEGELLWPLRLSAVVLDRLKRALGAYAYIGQYQQRPAPAQGGLFKREYFRYYSLTEDEYGAAYYLLHQKTETQRILASSCYTMITVDLASSLKEMADYTVVAVWAITPGTETLLVDLVRARLEIHEQQSAIERMYRKWQPQFVSVEAVSYQMTMIQYLLRQGLPVQPFRPTKDKVTRATTASIRYQQNMFYHPTGSAWVTDFESELLSFPRADHDDCVDVTSMIAELVATPVFARIRGLDDEEQIDHDSITREFADPPPEPEPMKVYGYGPKLENIEPRLLFNDDW